MVTETSRQAQQRRAAEFKARKKLEGAFGGVTGQESAGVRAALARAGEQAGEGATESQIAEQARQAELASRARIEAGRVDQRRQTEQRFFQQFGMTTKDFRAAQAQGSFLPPSPTTTQTISQKVQTFSGRPQGKSRFPREVEELTVVGGGTSIFGQNAIQRVAGGETAEDIRKDIPGARVSRKKRTFTVAETTPSRLFTVKERLVSSIKTVGREVQDRGISGVPIGLVQAPKEFLAGPTGKASVKRQETFQPATAIQRGEVRSRFLSEFEREQEATTFSPISTPTGPQIVARSSRGVETFIPTTQEVTRKETPQGFEETITLTPTKEFELPTERLEERAFDSIFPEGGPARKELFRREIAAGVARSLTFGLTGPKKEIIGEPFSFKAAGLTSELAVDVALIGGPTIAKKALKTKSATKLTTKGEQIIATKFPVVEIEQVVAKRIAPGPGKIAQKELFEVKSASKLSRDVDIIPKGGKIGSLFTTKSGRSPLEEIGTKFFRARTAKQKGGITKSGVIEVQKVSATESKGIGKLTIQEVKGERVFERGLKTRFGKKPGKDIKKDIEVIGTKTSFLPVTKEQIARLGPQIKSRFRGSATLKGEKGVEKEVLRSPPQTKFTKGKSIEVEVESRTFLRDPKGFKFETVSRGEIIGEKRGPFVSIAKSDEFRIATDVDEFAIGKAKGTTAERLGPGRFKPPTKSESAFVIQRPRKDITGKALPSSEDVGKLPKLFTPRNVDKLPKSVSKAKTKSEFLEPGKRFATEAERETARLKKLTATQRKRFKELEEKQILQPEKFTRVEEAEINKLLTKQSKFIAKEEAKKSPKAAGLEAKTSTQLIEQGGPVRLTPQEVKTLSGVTRGAPAVSIRSGLGGITGTGARSITTTELLSPIVVGRSPSQFSSRGEGGRIGLESISDFGVGRATPFVPLKTNLKSISRGRGVGISSPPTPTFAPAIQITGGVQRISQARTFKSDITPITGTVTEVKVDQKIDQDLIQNPVGGFTSISPFRSTFQTGRFTLPLLPFVPPGGGGGRRRTGRTRVRRGKTKFKPSLIGVEFQKYIKPISPKQAQRFLATGVGIRPVVRGKAPRVNRL